MGNALPKKPNKENSSSGIQIEELIASTAGTTFPITDEQKTLIRTSWTLLEQNIAQVGIIVFIKWVNYFPSPPHILASKKEMSINMQHNW